MEMFDPSTDQADIASLLQQVAALRKQQYNVPQGQMISGHYVAPAMSQQLQPVLSGIVSDVQEGRAREKQKDLETKAQADMVQWLRRRPQPQTVYGAGNEGPTMSVQQPTEAQDAAWASSGLRNPLTKDIANKSLTDVIVNAPVRAEKAADKKDLVLLTNQRFDEDRAARLQLARENAQNRWDMLQARLDQATAQGVETNGIRLQLGQAANEMRRLAIEAGDKRAADALAAKADAAANKGSAPKAMSASQQKEIAELSDMVGKIKSVNDNFKDEYAGGSNVLKTTVAPYGGLIPKKLYNAEDPKNLASTEYWRQYDAIGNFERHALFGSALTKVEQESWKKQALPNTATAAQIRQSNAIRTELAQKALQRRMDLYQGGTTDAATGATTPRAAPSRGAPLRNSGSQPVTTNARGNPTQHPDVGGQIETLLSEYRKPQTEVDYASLERELQRAGYRGPLPPRGVASAPTPAPAPASGGWSIVEKK